VAPVLRGERTSIHSEVFTHFRDVQRAIRTDRWKYIVYPNAHREQLFDLVADPAELHDLSESPEHHETLKSLQARLTSWRQLWNDSAN